MNITTYLFGNFKSGYAQYPQDDSQAIFQTFQRSCKARTQIAVHRQDNLIYYAYIRKLENDRNIGLCAVLNGSCIKHPHTLFPVFEKIMESMAYTGSLVHYDDNGQIVTSVARLYTEKEEIDSISHRLTSAFNKQACLPLPPVNYQSDNQTGNEFSVQDDSDLIRKSCYAHSYTMIYKSKDYDTSNMKSYTSHLKQLSRQIDTLKDYNGKLRTELIHTQRRQRNTKWVGVLSAVALILGFIVWNKVLFPSEVTKYNAGEYLYYGPMSHNKPNGVGVAIYRSNDKDQRLYYYGNFVNGERVDSDAIMFYRDGSYFKGAMKNDQWQKGRFTDVDGASFVGSFKNNQPSNGVWYRQVEAQRIGQGASSARLPEWFRRAEAQAMGGAE